MFTPKVMQRENLKHGPIALIDENMVNIAIIDPELQAKTMAGLSEVRARKGIIVSLSAKDNSMAQKTSNYSFPFKL